MNESEIRGHFFRHCCDITPGDKVEVVMGENKGFTGEVRGVWADGDLYIWAGSTENHIVRFNYCRKTVRAEVDKDQIYKDYIALYDIKPGDWYRVVRSFEQKEWGTTCSWFPDKHFTLHRVGKVYKVDGCGDVWLKFIGCDDGPFYFPPWVLEKAEAPKPSHTVRLDDGEEILIPAGFYDKLIAEMKKIAERGE